MSWSSWLDFYTKTRTQDNLATVQQTSHRCFMGNIDQLNLFPTETFICICSVFYINLLNNPRNRHDVDKKAVVLLTCCTGTDAAFTIFDTNETFTDVITLNVQNFVFIRRPGAEIFYFKVDYHFWDTSDVQVQRYYISKMITIFWDTQYIYRVAQKKSQDFKL
jgi:hypothetical protein